MSKFEITLKENGISVLEREQLYDIDGNPVSVSNHRKAVGIGDGDSVRFKAKVAELLEQVYGADLVELAAENTTQRALAAQLKSERDAVILERDAVILERDTLTTERDTLNEELVNARGIIENTTPSP